MRTELALLVKVRFWQPERSISIVIRKFRRNAAMKTNMWIRASAVVIAEIMIIP